MSHEPICCIRFRSLMNMTTGREIEIIILILLALKPTIHKYTEYVFDFSVIVID